MTDYDLDKKLTALLRNPEEPAPDPAFTERVVLLAAQDQNLRRRRGSAYRRVAMEAFGFAAVIGAFWFLSGTSPDRVGFGDTIPVGGPAMAGLLVLLMWSTTLLSPSRH